MGIRKPLYMWEPIFNKLTEITTEYANDVLNVDPTAVTKYVNNQNYQERIKCFFTRHPLTVAEKRKLIQKLEFKNEYWRECLPGLFVSNEGRFKGRTKTGYTSYLPYLNKNLMVIKYKKKEYNVKRIVYKAFYGNLSDVEVVHSKNGIKQDFRPDNLIKLTKEEAGKKTGYKAKRKGIVFVDEHGALLNEFKSTRDAERVTLYNRQTINECCKDKRKCYYSIGYRAFMWADDYYGTAR